MLERAQNYLRYCSEAVVWQEVPGETALAFTITGCQVGCKGCHSVDSWPAGSGIELTPSYLQQRLEQYRGLLTCVLFMGGEWQPQALLQLLAIARNAGLKTCLYTGLETIPLAIQQRLDYLKTGPWIAARGGLSSETTNQRFVDLRSGELLNVRFLN